MAELELQQRVLLRRQELGLLTCDTESSECLFLEASTEEGSDG